MWITSPETAHPSATASWSHQRVGAQNGEWAVIHRCTVCGKMGSNRIAADDNPMKLMALALRPYGSPRLDPKRIKNMVKTMEDKA